MRAYAGTLLSREDGVQGIIAHGQQSFDCLNYYSKLYPHHVSAFHLLADLRQQAYSIYLHRATSGPEGTSSLNQVRKFKETLVSLHDDTPGQHGLIWPCFIVASESIDPEDREFYRTYLMRHYRRNGFSNILTALELLNRIWARDDHIHWPDLLPEPGVFIM